LLPLSRFLDQQRVDLVLRKGVRARFLPGENQLRALWRPPQRFRIAEVVVNNDVGLLDAFFGPQRHQPEIARSRAYEEAFPFLRRLSH
jgi:hypothetical protein